MKFYMPRGLMILPNTQTNENDKARNAIGGNDTYIKLVNKRKVSIFWGDKKENNLIEN